mgnify:CR=1 FL=1
MLDSHCHLDDAAIYEDRKQVVEEAKEAGVSLMVTIGCDLESSKKAVAIAHEFDGVYAAVGFHPQNLENISDEALDEIRKLASDSKVIAIGEIGLDYYGREEIPKEPEWAVRTTASRESSFRTASTISLATSAV